MKWISSKSNSSCDHGMNAEDILTKMAAEKACKKPPVWATRARICMRKVLTRSGISTIAPASPSRGKDVQDLVTLSKVGGTSLVSCSKRRYKCKKETQRPGQSRLILDCSQACKVSTYPRPYLTRDLGIRGLRSGNCGGLVAGSSSAAVTPSPGCVAARAIARRRCSTALPRSVCRAWSRRTSRQRCQKSRGRSKLISTRRFSVRRLVVPTGPFIDKRVPMRSSLVGRHFVY